MINFLSAQCIICFFQEDLGLLLVSICALLHTCRKKFSWCLFSLFHISRSEADRLISSPAVKDLEVVVDTRLNINQQNAVIIKKPRCLLSCMRRNTMNRLSNIVVISLAGETPPEILSGFLQKGCWDSGEMLPWCSEPKAHNLREAVQRSGPA